MRPGLKRVPKPELKRRLQRLCLIRPGVRSIEALPDEAWVKEERLYLMRPVIKEGMKALPGRV